jgi:tripartite-type tricarboxylate transporter receptor subunit TctC
MRRRDFLALGAAGVFAGAARADTYPDHAIRLIVPWAPGGVNDAAGRPWAEKVRGSLGAVVIDNIAGAGSIVGTTAAARATPDGYTLLLGGGATHIINPIASTRPIYDPIKDFDPIAILSISGVAMAVHPSLGVNTLRELIAMARAQPGALSYASPGVGSAAHLGGEMFKSLAGVRDIVHVPYRGGGPALADLVAGQIKIAALNVTGEIIALQKSGHIKLLSVSTPRRIAAAPDIPTGEEAGLPGYIALNFAGVFAPAHTPRAAIDKVAAATREAMADKDYLAILAASGFEPSTDTNPEAAGRFVNEEIARWRPIIKEIGFKLE